MKINSKINKRVQEAVSECRKCIIEATIELLQKMGAEPGQDVLFRRMLFLYQAKGNTTETIICDRIAYAGREGSQPYYIVSMGKDEYVAPASDLFLSLSNLQAVYEEVRRVVREY